MPIQSLLMAADRGDVEKMKSILFSSSPQRQFDLKSLKSPQEIISFFDSLRDPFSGQTVLHIAAALGRRNILEFLLNEVLVAENFPLLPHQRSESTMQNIKSAIVNVQDKDDKWTCLFSSVIASPNLEIVKLLIENGGADIAMKDVYGGTVLEIARNNDHTPKEIVQYLAQKMVNVSDTNEETRQSRVEKSDGNIKMILESLLKENEMLKVLLEQERDEHLMTKLRLVQAEKQLAELRQ